MAFLTNNVSNESSLPSQWPNNNHNNNNNNNNNNNRRNMKTPNNFPLLFLVVCSLCLIVLVDRETSSFGLVNVNCGRTPPSSSSTSSSSSSIFATVEAWSLTSSFRHIPRYHNSCHHQSYPSSSSSSSSSSAASLFSTSTPSVDEKEPESLQSKSDAIPTTTSTPSDDDESSVIFETEQQKVIHDFCVGTNNFWKQLVIKPVRDYVEIRQGPSTTTTNRQADGGNSGGMDIDAILSKLIAPPELPGISRPVWFTILGSVPTALGWYGYYKFCVEEELYQYELQSNKPVTGCGGYGTLFPFVYGVLIGFPLSLIPVDGSDIVMKAAAFWILAGQVNLYRRVNELCSSDSDVDNDDRVISAEMEKLYSDKLNNEPPLYEWWALLPPPLDVVVGLRQVHFLSEYWRIQRDEPYDKDLVAEELFPFISAPRFTLKQFVKTPSMWFWFTKDWEDFDFEFLRD